MKWLVQEMLNNPSNMIRVIEALELLQTEYLLVKVDSHALTVIDNKTKLPLEDSSTIIDDFVSGSNVMVYGSKMLAEIADNMKLTPGSFMNERFEYDAFKQHLGTELLNHDLTIGELWDIEPIHDLFFMRPTGNTKLFSGQQVSKEEFYSLKRREMKGMSAYTGQPIMISPLQTIHAEYRFFVVQQQIVTYSSYQYEGSLNTLVKPTPELIQYTLDRIHQFALAEAFVIDVAETTNGFKVVEYNNINTSGLYGCDEVALVSALNQLAESK